MSNKKKVLFVITNMETGGVQRALVNLLNEIRHKYDVYLYAFSYSGAMCSLVPKGVTILDSPALVKLWGLSQQKAFQLGKSKGLFRGLIALYCKFFSNAIPLWISQHTQKKLTGFDYAISYRQNDHTGSMYTGCLDFVIKRVDAKQKIAFLHCDYSHTLEIDCCHNYELLNKMDKIVCVSRGCLKNLLTVHPDFVEKSYYTYNCYDFEEIVQKSSLSKPEFDPGQINLVIAARISEEKGIDRAIRVVNRLVNEGYPVALHVVGDGPQWGIIEKLIGELGCASYIKMHGNKENPYPYIAAADLLLISSYHEAAPMVIGEAKALKTPVLTTESASAGEQVKIGQEGFICHNSEQGIYDSLKMILDNPHLLDNCRTYLADSGFTNQEGLNQFEAMLTAPVLSPVLQRVTGTPESRLNHG